MKQDRAAGGLIVNWTCLSLLAVLLTACPVPAYCDELADSTSSPEAQRFEAAKRIRLRQAVLIYAATAKRLVDKSWQDWKPPANGKLLITKVKVTLDSVGKVTGSKVVSGSGSEQEDKSVQDCLSEVTYMSLPFGLTSLDLFWTLMSDGTMNMVESTDSSEANAYYSNLIGATISPGGGSGYTPSMIAARMIAGGQSADTGPYMADLQRRIKRAWFPPKGNESKQIVVVFKIHRNGDMSDLRIDHSSGVAVADQAALKAVQNAAPFRPLPAGAKDPVEIQFTYDYNVFSGGGHGTFRSY